MMNGEIIQFSRGKPQISSKLVASKDMSLHSNYLPLIRLVSNLKLEMDYCRIEERNTGLELNSEFASISD